MRLHWKQSATLRYAVYGALFGLSFPVLSLIFEIIKLHLPWSLGSVLAIHEAHPLLYIIDTAPIFLGLFASIVGRQQDALNYLNQSLEEKVVERTRKLEEKNRHLAAEIEHRKKVEAELVNALDAAEEASRAKSRFLSTMSHEIRTPLNAVIGMTGLLLESELNEEQRDYAETIRISGENLLGVINNILDFSKIESGKLELEKQEFNLTDIVEDVMDLLSAKATEKNIELIRDIEPDVPQSIISDPTRLRQVLVNLVNNALKFTEEGEVLVHVSLLEKKDGVLTLQFDVKDTGIGIPAEKLETIFESFSQADSSTTRKYGGSGLGLAISKRLVNLLGGDIQVRSQVGKGTTFSFTIKALPGKTETLKRPSLEALKGKKALIVDDNQTNLLILGKQLAGWGIETYRADSPKKALELLDQGIKPDFAIFDMHMPGMDGLQLTKEIKSREEWKSLPVIMLTSLGETPAREYQWLFAAYMIKPVRQNRLLKSILEIFSIPTGNIHLAHSSRKSTGFRHNRKLRILLAEDNPINQKVALRQLKKLGYQADVASNGLEAVKAAKQIPYDLILMDVQMPEMDGIEASRTILQWYQENRPEQRPVIIAMTASVFTDDKKKCLDAGMDDFLSKPVELSSLEEKIIAHFYRKSA